MKKIIFIFMIITTFCISSIVNADGVKKPKDVYESNFNLNLPIIQKILSDKKMPIPHFTFEKEKGSATPAEVYLKIYETYAELASKFELPPLEKKKKENIQPADVVLLTKDFNEILKNKWGAGTVDAQLNKEYMTWKKNYRNDGEDIVPGDTIKMITYMLTLAQSLK